VDILISQSNKKTVACHSFRLKSTIESALLFMVEPIGGISECCGRMDSWLLLCPLLTDATYVKC